MSNIDMEEMREKELRFIEQNIDALAELAAGNFIDTTIRPKKDRVKFTAKFYREHTLDNVEHWRKEPIDDYARCIYGVMEMAQNALLEQFGLYLQVYNILNQRIDREIAEADAKKKARLIELRTAQADMEPFDANRRCLACGQFLFEYDEKNNQRHKKKEICTCNSSRAIQAQMKARISQYRKELAEKRKVPKKDPKRFDKK